MYCGCISEKIMSIVHVIIEWKHIILFISIIWKKMYYKNDFISSSLLLLQWGTESLVDWFLCVCKNLITIYYLINFNELIISIFHNYQYKKVCTIFTSVIEENKLHLMSVFILYILLLNWFKPCILKTKIIRQLNSVGWVSQTTKDLKKHSLQ